MCMGLRYNLCVASTSESGQFDYLLLKKKIDLSFPCVCPVIDNEFRHNIVAVVGRSIYLDNVMTNT